MSISIAKVIGKAIMLASIQSALGSVEMSSRFSVLNFSKDQQTLQNAANALSAYIVIGTVWTIGSILVLYSSYNWTGFFASLVCNGIIMAWIIISYTRAFKSAVVKRDKQIEEWQNSTDPNKGPQPEKMYVPKLFADGFV
jgi:hypothetical protein